MQKILLDVNAYLQLLRGSEKVLDALTEAEEVYMSVFVLCELYCGFKGGGKEVENKKLLEQMLDKPTVIIVDATKETAEIFSFISHEVKKNGTLVSYRKMWIAAHAMETGSTLITFDSHFCKIPGLRVWDEIS